MYHVTNLSKRVRKSCPETQIRIAVFLGHDLVWEPWLVEACGSLGHRDLGRRSAAWRGLAHQSSRPGASEVWPFKKLEYSMFGGSETGGLEDLRL